MVSVVAASQRILPWVLLVSSVLSTRIEAQRVARHELPLRDWPQFGSDVASSGAPIASTGITPANIGLLSRRQVHLDGTVDASAIYLHHVVVNGSNHDVFFVTTSYGKTIAIDADSAAVLWEYTPADFATWAGTAQITNSTPSADPDRQHIYAAAPDGAVRKLAIADGHAEWTTSITLLPSREKITSAIKVFDGRVIAVTGGYIGDANPYQGHVAVLDTETGTLQHVWNSLCSDRPGLIQPASCQSSRSAIWGRAGAAIDPSTGNIFVATGNGPYNGTTDWGDSVIELDPDATVVLANYSPIDNATLEQADLDLGSTSPVLVGSGALAQGGKDGIIRLLDINSLAGAVPHTGNELQAAESHSLMFSAAAVWHDGVETWIFAGDIGGTAAWTVGKGKMTPMWSNTVPGTSPVVAGRLLYVYNPNGGLRAYDPRTGKAIATLECGGGHWNSPVVVDGRIALPEGTANQHSTDGVLDIWTVASSR